MSFFKCAAIPGGDVFGGAVDRLVHFYSLQDLFLRMKSNQGDNVMTVRLSCDDVNPPGYLNAIETWYSSNRNICPVNRLFRRALCRRREESYGREYVQ